MEDTVTYVDEPEALGTHLANLEGLRRLEVERILPNHGDPETIASGGYTTDLITATEHYIRALRASREQRELRQVSLREFIAEPLEAGWVHYFAPYEAVHRGNIKTVLAR
jgi:hypothetical protein